MQEIPNLVWITDRTIDDVKFISQDTIDVGKLAYHKGALNYTDLNRINDNFIKIGIILDKLGYYNKIGTNKTTWIMSDIPYLEDVNELRNICKNVRNMLNITKFLKEIRFWDTLNYEDVNIIEETIKMIGDMTSKLQQQQLYCGEVISGGEY